MKRYTGNPLQDIISEDASEIVKKIDFNELNNKTVLVTGASGLIGTYILACLNETINRTQRFINVFAVIHSSPPTNYFSLFKENNFQFIRGDLTDSNFCLNLPNADYIIHAAGYGQPGRFMQSPIKTIQINSTVTQSLLEKLNNHGKFIFLSSSEVYSGLKNVPYKESDIGNTNTNHFRSCYIEGKRCGEAICYAYRSQGAEAKSARVALAYGPGTRVGDRRVLNAFIEKGLNGKINLLDQGKSKRTYCYVADTVEIMWNILLFGKEPIYNIGGVSTTTIAALAREIGEILNVPVVFPNENNNIKGAPVDVSLDMSLVKHEFNKNDYIPLKVGLARTIEWQKSLYNFS